MKITRKMLLIIIGSMGALLILYSLVRHFAGLQVNENIERRAIDVVIIAALILFLYNRKMLKNEKLAKEKEDAKQRAEEAPVEQPTKFPAEESGNEDHLPHWERKDYNRDD